MEASVKKREYLREATRNKPRQRESHRSANRLGPLALPERTSA
jgi:hypothetical protein